MKKYLFIDRDGTLILEPEDEQIDSLEKLTFYPGVFRGLAAVASRKTHELVMVTNQDGLGTRSFPEEDFWPAQNKMIAALENEGITFSEILIDRSFPAENKETRKPGTGLLNHLSIDPAHSYVIGDRLSDMELARNLGCHGILINDGSLRDELVKTGWAEVCVLITTSWAEIEQFLRPARKAVVSRTTSETEIHVEVNLDGQGHSEIATGIGFFDHMLEQLSRHGLIDLNIRVSGDLHIDEHHTIEDTAITLGECFHKALGDKRGLFRYGFTLPMDDCLAQVAIDFGGRPWLVWEADFRREHIGEMPTEMFLHFFKSFSDAARCNLNIKAEGDNEHHKIEAIFKAFARAIRMAVQVDHSNDQLPSTKGLL